MPKRSTFLQAWVDKVVAAVDEGCTSPDTVLHWLVHSETLPPEQPGDDRRRTVVFALECAAQDGRIEWPRSPDGNLIDGGIRSTASA